MAAIVANYIIFWFIFKNDLRGSYPVDESVNARSLIKSKTMVAVGLAVLAFVLIGCGFANWLLLPLSVVTTIGAIAIYLAEEEHRRPRPGASHGEWSCSCSRCSSS